MVDLASIGTAVNIAGKAASFLGLGGDDGPDIEEQYNQSREHMAKAPSAIRKGAERAGFNPLTVLTSGAVGGSPGISLPSRGMNRMSALEGIGTALTQHTETQEAALTNKVNRQIAEVQLERAQAGGAGDVFTRTRNAGITYIPGGRGPRVADTSDPLKASRMYDDGLPGPNPDNPIAPEDDLYRAARAGELIPHMKEIYDRNVPLAFRPHDWADPLKKKAGQYIKNGLNKFTPLQIEVK